MLFSTLRRGLRIPTVVGASLLLALSSLFALTPSAVAGAATPLTALIYGPSLSNGASSMEVAQLEALGYDVTIATDAQWAAMSTAQFSSYGLLVIADPYCDDVFGGALDSTASNWTSAVNGNVVILGTDPAYHGQYLTGPVTLANHALAFAGSVPGETGLYLDLSCSSSSSQPVLDALESGFGIGHGSYNSNSTDVTAAGSAALNVSAADISNWHSSVHEYLGQWPADFTPLGIVQSSNGCATLVTTPGGLTGCPYIVGRGMLYTSAPHLVNVVRSGTNLTASWQAGITSGPFVCTLLYGLNAPSSFTVRTNSTSCTFYGLSPSTPYGVRVTSGGGAGGSASAWSAPVKTTITCVRGSTVRHVTGYAPSCPAGFHVRP